MKEEKLKVVTLLSGGLDSTTLAYFLHPHYELHTLSFNYGQKHKKELNCSREIAKELNIPHKEVDITPIQTLISKGALTGDDPMPLEHYTHENQKVTIVPNRNAILLSLATGYAVKIGAEIVAYAAHHNDYTIYPDCRPKFVTAFENTMKIANAIPSFKILAPFLHLKKSDIVGIAKVCKVPFEKTWSCYVGEDEACGECGTCQERIEAFKTKHLEDPIPYKIKVDWK